MIFFIFRINWYQDAGLESWKYFFSLFLSLTFWIELQIINNQIFLDAKRASMEDDLAEALASVKDLVVSKVHVQLS